MNTTVRSQSEMERVLAQGLMPRCEGPKSFYVTEGVVVGHRAFIIAEGRSVVHAMRGTTVRAAGDAIVYAHDDAAVEASGRTHVVASDEARVQGHHQASIYATHEARVSANDRCLVIARGKSVVNARNRCRIDAGDTSRVQAENQARVILSDFANVYTFNSAVIYRVAETSGEIHVGANTTIVVPDLSKPINWCLFYDAKSENGIVTLYKAVDLDYSTEKGRAAGIDYAPGSVPVAPDWDNGESECGGGLHLCPAPIYTLDFYLYPPRFVACPVRFEDIRVFPTPKYPAKVKVRAVSGPCYEVDLAGQTEPRWPLARA